MVRTVERVPGGVRLIDQRKLPLVEDFATLSTPEEVAEAIRAMVVRGAPAIGCTAAFGMALAATRAAASGAVGPAFDDALGRARDVLAASRPTAVNLFWALERMMAAATAQRAAGASEIRTAEALEREAQAVYDEDLAACRAIGRHGATLVPARASILTHCNAGGLATAGYGTALGVVRGAIEAGKSVRVLAGETRPFLQGARLTAWELMQDGIDTVLITDGMSGSLMRSGEVDLVVVGADRIASNGDVANKIGTYNVAVLAKENGIPFLVAAPLSTIDLACADGDAIPIEERDPREVTELGGIRTAPEGVGVRNPAFDVTPERYVTAIVTERGIARRPYDSTLPALFR